MATHRAFSEPAGIARRSMTRPLSARIAVWLALVFFVVALILTAWGASAV